MTEYEQAYREFFVAKKWIKGNKELLKAEYADNGLDIPCDGYVQTKRDARKALRYYNAFHMKLLREGSTNEKIDACFKKTKDKYARVMSTVIRSKKDLGEDGYIEGDFCVLDRFHGLKLTDPFTKPWIVKDKNGKKQTVGWIALPQPDVPGWAGYGGSKRWINFAEYYGKKEQ